MESVKNRLFRVNRNLDAGSFKISDIFPGFHRNPILLEIFDNPEEVNEVWKSTAVKIIERRTYMFVDNEDGSISIGISHLKESEETVLYLDIVHELVHVKQHRKGLDLYDRSVSYVDRPTEIEAYAITVREARRIGLTDVAIFEYLSVDWISSEEHCRLAKRLNVAVAEGC